MRSVRLWISIGAFLLGSIVLAVDLIRSHVPYDKRVLIQLFAAETRLTDVDVGGYEKGAIGWPIDEDFRIMGASVRIKDRPGAFVVFDHPRPELFTGADHVRIGRIGPYVMVESRRTGPSSWTTRAVDFGPAGDLAGHMPFQVRTVRDVIDHYDDLVALVAKLPREEGIRSGTDGEQWVREVRRATDAPKRHRARGASGAATRAAATAPADVPQTR